MTLEQLVTFCDEWELRQFSRDQQKASWVLISYNIGSKDLRRPEPFQKLWTSPGSVVGNYCSDSWTARGHDQNRWELLKYGTAGVLPVRKKPRPSVTPPPPPQAETAAQLYVTYWAWSHSRNSGCIQISHRTVIFQEMCLYVCVNLACCKLMGIACYVFLP